MSFSFELDADSESAAGTLERFATADFGTRFAAWLFDAVALFAAQWVVVIVLTRQLQLAGMVSDAPCEPDSPFTCQGPNTVLWVIVFVLVAVTTFGYHAWFDGQRGATPAKRWLNLRVVDADDHESVIGVQRGLVRAVARQSVWVWAFLFLGASPISISVPSLIWFGLFGLSLLPLITAAVAESGRGLHDIAANSHVVRVGPIAAPSVAGWADPDTDTTRSFD